MRFSLGPIPARGLAPAAITTVCLLVLWIYGRWWYVPPVQQTTLGVSVLAGWLCSMFLLVTVVAVIAAAAEPQGYFPRGRVFFGYSLLTDLAGLLLLLVGRGDHGLSLPIIVALYVLLAAWTALWAAMAAWLRGWGSGWSAAVTLSLAMLAMTSPVTAMPLVRAAPLLGPKWQGLIVSIITHTCPLLPMFDVLRPEAHLDWGQLPGMYRYSGLGQSIPATLPTWWSCASIYAGAALPLAWLARPRRPRAIAPRSMLPAEQTPAP
jgi:hypothetical protein